MFLDSKHLSYQNYQQKPFFLIINVFFLIYGNYLLKNHWLYHSIILKFQLRKLFCRLQAFYDNLQVS